MKTPAALMALMLTAQAPCPFPDVNASTCSSPGIVTLSTTPQGMVAGTRSDGTVVQTATPPNPVSVLSYQKVTNPPSGAMIQMLANKAVLSLLGSSLVALLTVELPPNPQDGQLVRIASQFPIGTLTVEDASGNADGTAYALGAMTAGDLYQFQSTSWIKIS